MTNKTRATEQVTNSSDAGQLSQTCRAVFDSALSSRSKSAFYTQSLSHISDFFACPYAMIHVRLSSEIIEDYRHSGATSPNFWKPVVQDFLNQSLTDNRTQSKFFSRKKSQGGDSVCLLSSPIYNSGGSPVGAVVIVVCCEDVDSIPYYKVILESLACMVSYSAENIGGANNESGSQDITSGKYLSRTAGYSSGRELAFAVTNILRNKTESNMAVLGLVNRRRVKIIAISGQDDVKKRSPDVIRIREAMEECLDTGGRVIYGQGSSSEEPAKEYRLHRQWHEAAGHDVVVSIPLRVEEECVAILSLRRNGSQPFSGEELQKISDLAEPYAPAFELVEKANRGLLSHGVESVRNIGHAAVEPGMWTRKAAVLLSVVFSIWFFFGTISYNVTAPGTVVPRKIRHFAAPVNGVLESALVVQGDYVHKGDVLCEFNREELRLERSELTSQLRIFQIEQDEAKAGNSFIDSELAQANQELARTKIKIISHKIDQSIIRAPFDGIVISGDLRKHVGDVFAMGEPLFELAYSQQWLVELEVPESLSADLETGFQGRFVTNARPGLKHELRITRISPNAEIRRNRNVFVAEADMDTTGEWIKAGMEGTAQVDIGSRPVWWVAFHRVFDYVRLKFW